MNSYLIKFIEIFESILKEYNFNIRSYYDEDHSGIIVIYNNKFELHFGMNRESTDIAYCKLLPNNQLLWYSISNFIVSKINDNDRIINDESLEEQSKNINIYNRNIRSLKYRFNILNNHFSDLLSGGEKWIQLFEKSEWYSEPIVRERKI